MKLLDKNNNLKAELDSYEEAEIIIVSAFVSGILDHLKELIKKNKHVSLYTGVLNGFNNPNELRQIYHLAKKNKKFDFYVNFEEKTSTHWKLYLVNPSTVITGSANYTKVGLEMTRDTMIVEKNSEIYNKYLKKISINNKYYTSKKNDFLSKLTEYESGYKKAYANDSANEVNVEIPLFIWQNLLSNQQKNEIEKKANKHYDIPDMKIDRRKVRDFFCMPKNESLYIEGDRVFCMKDDGRYPSFHYFDRIFSDDDTTYMISLKRANGDYGKYPIKIKDAKKALLNMSENGKISLGCHSVSLNDLLKNLE